MPINFLLEVNVYYAKKKNITQFCILLKVLFILYFQMSDVENEDDERRVVKEKKKRPPRKKYSQETLAEALDEMYFMNADLNKTATKFGIPNSTLSDKWNKRHQGANGKFY